MMAKQIEQSAGSRVEIARFTGRSRAEAKRKALNYWFVHKAALGMDVREFSARCRLLEDDRTIVLYSA